MGVRFILVVVLFFSLSNTIQAFPNYSVFVAGHVYGSHSGDNVGLHPPFLNKMLAISDTSASFIFLTGDIVNHSNEESWRQVGKELDSIGIPAYYVMGNHDENSIGYDEFIRKHGATFYSFIHQSELFIVLNSTIQQRSISDEQITFLSNELANAGEEIKNVFVFFHEILWNSDEKYKDVLSNSRSRYKQIKEYSNYWDEVHPLLHQTGKNVFVIGGDVAGNTDAIPAFYDVWDNVTLIASGMGEVKEENYLKVNIQDETISFELIGLQDDVEMQAIEYYSMPLQPDTIYGSQLVDVEVDFHSYWIENIYNADSYLWEFSEGIEGNSTTNSIEISFNEDFIGGEIQIQAFHSGYGYSSPKSLKIDVETRNSLLQMSSNSDDVSVNYYQSGNSLYVKLEGEINSKYLLSLYDLSGKCLQSKFCENNNDFETTFSSAGLSANLYLLVLSGPEKQLVSKIIFK